MSDYVNRFLFVLKYIRYYITASTPHDLHSPFIFKLMTEVIKKDKSDSAFRPAETLRRESLRCTREIKITDLGAGSSTGEKNTRSIRSIARISSKPPRYGRLLYRLSKHFAPSEILELGTSLGIGSLYLHTGSPESNLITIEGCPAIAEVAQQNFRDTGSGNITLIQGSFETVLPEVLRKTSKLDLVYFDGNHRLLPTLDYFHQCLSKAHDGTVFIFDDIHWSAEMEEAWKEIKSHPSVTVTADLFFMGLVFFRMGQEKQHFILRY